MPKIIIFCADGTWNGPDKDNVPDDNDNPTNVFKLFVNLDGIDDPLNLRLRNEQERTLAEGGAVTQIAKYIHGVGDSNNKLVQLLGGAFGAGTIARIVRGYTFISRNYRPDDRIFITGFSRGAYTARALAGLISTQGLLDGDRHDLEDKELAYRLGAAVWYEYRKTARQNDDTWFGRLQEAITDLPNFLTRPITPPQRITGIDIDVVAVWDTVGSLGIPTYSTDSDRRDAFRFADNILSARARRGFHAIAVDEQRFDFTPTLWAPDARVVQHLFPGAHSDVGGGYRLGGGESGLSDCAFVWMRDRLAEAGVKFLPSSPIPITPNPLGPAHTPWLDSPFNVLLRAPRRFATADLLIVSQCLRDRFGGGNVISGPDQPSGPYQPNNLLGYLP